MPGPQSGGETAKDPSALTPDILNVHIQAILTERDKLYDERDRRYHERFDAQEKAVEAALTAAQKAVDVAEVNAEKWRAASNEWRAAMDDRERNFITRNEANASHDSMEKQVDTLHDQITEWKGREKGLSLTTSVIVGAVGFVATVIAIYLALN